jgi:hypothetical protein
VCDAFAENTYDVVSAASEALVKETRLVLAGTVIFVELFSAMFANHRLGLL